MGPVNYPPEKIYSHSKIEKPNYDHIILWMLYNNETCKWADFRQGPIQISTGTLSRHLETLKRKGLVENFTRGHYRITSEGKNKFHELSSDKKTTRKLNYPPKLILKSGRNYSHWILWMVYNNNSCKRSDFLKAPMSINQSSLSKNLSLLIGKGLIIKEEGKFLITRAGKSEYSRMLQNYDLDRQTILEEESKRIEEITTKAIQLFEKYKIKEEDIQFRFLSNILRLDYEKVKPLLKNEEIFHKIVLFLSINHPDQYPSFITPEDFSRNYTIKKTTLDYYIDEISEGKIYPLRYFKLTHPSGAKYYFQSDGNIERILRVITENLITRATYLDKLISNRTSKLPTLDMKNIINEIADKSCEFLFSKDLNLSIKDMLPEYLNYLTYKIETKRELKDINDKLENLIWENLTVAFKEQFSESFENQFEEQIKDINEKIETNPDKLDLYYSRIKIMIYFNQYRDAIESLNNMLEIFPESEKDIMMLKAVVLRRMQNIEAGLEIINELIQKYPNDKDLMCYKAYWMQYLGNEQKAKKIIQNLTNEEPENGIYQDTFGEILMYFEEYDEATTKFLKAITDGNDEWYIPITYIKLGICYKALGNDKLAQNNLKKGKDLVDKGSYDPETKQKWITIADLTLHM